MNQLNVNNFLMAYEKLGNRPENVVLIHGNLASKRWWNLVKGKLAERFTVYMIDLRGCGESEQPTGGYSVPQYGDDVAAFIQRLGLNKVSLVGHSMGGAIAMDVASKLPEFIDRVVLLNPAPVSGYSVTEEKLELIKKYSEDRELLKLALAATVPSYSHLPFFLQLFEDALRAAFTAVHNVCSLAEVDYTLWAKQFSRPVLLLYGEQDNLIPLDAMEKTRNIFRNCTMITHSGVGHSPQVEDPEWFIKQMVCFFE